MNRRFLIEEDRILFLTVVDKTVDDVFKKMVEKFRLPCGDMDPFDATQLDISKQLIAGILYNWIEKNMQEEDKPD